MIFKQLEVDYNKINGFGVDGSEKIVKKLKKLKSQKLFKSGNLKGKKLFKSQKLAKSEKKLLNNKNLSNFSAMKTKLKFPIPNTKTAYNHLWLAFIKALIL